MVYSKKEREQYNRDRMMTCERLQIRELDYNAFRRLGQKLHSLYEDDCNGLLTEKEYEKDTNVFYEKADKLAKRLNLYIFYQTDPRGATIYLSKDPIADNNYNRLGSECIY